MLQSSRSARQLDSGSSLQRDGAPKTIGLLDHMGYGNLDGAAILETVLQVLGNAPTVDSQGGRTIVCVSPRPASSVHG